MPGRGARHHQVRDVHATDDDDQQDEPEEGARRCAGALEPVVEITDDSRTSHGAA
jgi:hypothetical protein